MVMMSREKDRGNKNMKDGSEWKQNDRKTITEAEVGCMRQTKIPTGDREKTTRRENLENCCSMR